MRSRLLAVAVLLALASVAGPSSASSVSELVKSARVHEAASEDSLAIRRYMEALALDPTFEEAYAGLGAIRQRRGDLREADRVYSVALARLPRFNEARLERARVRWMLGERPGAVDDIETLAREDPLVLRELAGWYGDAAEWPAQLALWRRLFAFARATAAERLGQEARAMVRALQILVEHADPVSSPHERTGVRRTISEFARQGL